MRILICCEAYAPAQGGVSKVMQEVAEHLARRGHAVTVAAGFHSGRSFNELNGVAVRQFKVSGNLVNGIQGDVEGYRNFVADFAADAILIKAAQQWSFDALWPILPGIKARKVFIPCGFSSIYEPAYADYFQQMPDILRRFDHLIFYAGNYRDLPFAREHGIEHYSIIPNGASAAEFGSPPASDIRDSLSILRDDFIFLTVGNPPFRKGHAEVAQAYEMLQVPFGTTLILNGAYAEYENPLRWGSGRRAINSLRALKRRLLSRPQHPEDAFASSVNSIRRQPGKRIIIADLSRRNLLSAFFSANLFVFASPVEYSPLVLFEAAAAGLPFLSVPAGNAAEIAEWTGGGEICPAGYDERGYVRVDPAVLAGHMAHLACDPQWLTRLRNTGREKWQEQFTWEKIALQYEQALRGDSSC